MKKVILIGIAILAMASCSSSDDGFVEEVQGGVENPTAGNPNSDGNGGYNQPSNQGFLNTGNCNVKITKYRVDYFRHHNDTTVIDITTVPINTIPTSNVLISCGQIKTSTIQATNMFRKYDANY
ncbi:hypothetical protein ACFPVY_04085 [Flavobacterium qiangtangense]|uniref:Lipoprotein n=1 Tax=Flavobacterium qiangtangense TaxID=1442595 RepID=A0ABW1PLJ1_9FLAO